MASVVSVMFFQPSFKGLSDYFYVSLNLTGILLFPDFTEFSDTAPLMCTCKSDENTDRSTKRSLFPVITIRLTNSYHSTVGKCL